MKILSDSQMMGDPNKYDPEYIAAAIDELAEQRDRGEIELHSYITKKQMLVRLFLEATTTPQREPRAPRAADS